MVSGKSWEGQVGREDRCAGEQRRRRRRRRKGVNNLQDERGGSGAEQRCVFVTAAQNPTKRVRLWRSCEENRVFVIAAREQQF